jgi:hypothetical protein
MPRRSTDSPCSRELDTDPMAQTDDSSGVPLFDEVGDLISRVRDDAALPAPDGYDH